MFTTILSCGLRGARRSGGKGAWRLNCGKHTGCGRRTREPPPKLDFILNAMRSHWKFQAEQWHDLIYAFQANSQGWVKTGGGAGEEAEWGHYLPGLRLRRGRSRGNRNRWIQVTFWEWRRWEPAIDEMWGDGGWPLDFWSEWMDWWWCYQLRLLRLWTLPSQDVTIQNWDSFSAVRAGAAFCSCTYTYIWWKGTDTTDSSAELKNQPYLRFQVGFQSQSPQSIQWRLFAA